MSDFLKKMKKKLSEPSTYAGISALFLLLGVNVPPGLIDTIANFGTAAGGLLAVLIREKGDVVVKPTTRL